jgi:hypothetical protein
LGSYFEPKKEWLDEISSAAADTIARVPVRRASAGISR